MPIRGSGYRFFKRHGPRIRSGLESAARKVNKKNIKKARMSIRSGVEAIESGRREVGGIFDEMSSIGDDLRMDIGDSLGGKRRKKRDPFEFDF